MTKAFDISHHNGQDIKQLLKRPEDAPTFLYIKRSEGQTIVQDEYYNDLYLTARNNGIIYGGYHYINPSSKHFDDLIKEYGSALSQIANVEASRLLDIVKAPNTYLVPMMDVEEKYLVKNITNCVTYLDRVCHSYFTQGGKKLGIYASHSVLNTSQMIWLIQQYNLVVWDARYKYKDAKLHVDAGINDIVPLLQRNINGTIDVDINQICTKYVDYNGKTWDLDCDIVYNPLKLML